MPKPLTRAEKLRSMSDEELAGIFTTMWEIGVPDVCRNLDACDEDLENDVLIPFERCVGCMLYWLQDPKEVWVW